MHLVVPFPTGGSTDLVARRLAEKFSSAMGQPVAVLALHLSVPSLLPWLVIDDPVQGMDEVHIAQFAALLRTLSKQHERQIFVGVHEKPLFEYLSLELCPAFRHDRLVTLDLGRGADGTTVPGYEPVSWTPDPAVAA